MTLLIMAAGIGSRFGGLKQLQPVGPNGEFIIDYSIYDAIQAGFDKIVFIIKKENYEMFKNTIGKRVEGKINVEYVFQDFSNVPSDYLIPESRVKPLGTGHAILCSKNTINEKFAVITADDFYGRDAFLTLAKFLNKIDNNENKYAVICYDIDKTINSNDSVKRGICYIENSYITNMIESKIEIDNGKLVAYPLSGEKHFDVDSNTKVSMSIFAFTPKMFETMEKDFRLFLEENKNNLLTAEYLLPDYLNKIIDTKLGTLEALSTTSSWSGVTYKEDVIKLSNHINELITRGIYPNNLY